MNDKLKKIMIMVIGIFVVILLFLFLISSCQSKYTPQKLETKIYESSKKYFSIHDDELPSDGNSKSYSLSDLENLGIIKNLEKILDKDTLCSGDLTIENNNNYYMYSPKLNCTTKNSTYKSENLKDLLLQNIVSSGNGLYQLNNAYYFRGDEVDNYLMFDGMMWRITKINEDGTLRLIEVKKRDTVSWDDRYNSEETTSSGKNNYVDNGINSRIKDNLDNIYKNDEFSDDAKGYIKPFDLCIGKRSEDETINDGSIECSEVIQNQYLGLLQINEYLLASLDMNCFSIKDRSCRNYNYLADFINTFWTITADSSNTYKVFKISTTPLSTRASTKGVPKLVINISSNTFVTGKGTEDEPFIVVGMTNELRKDR